MKLNVKDNANEDMEKFMRQGIAFIESAHADPSSIVFVHCKMGVSRSATIVIAYLMKAMEWTEAKAFDFLRRRRPGIQPNLGFMITLRNWERELFGKTADMGSMGSRDGLGNAGSKEFLGSTSQLVEAQQVAMVL
ncbi:phosphatases II [Gonapodya prolifera JEL478]|uniref:protein-tyrosine-phosphatase n=1 Tax=Gonapodya prolifera (strain JEL478) TaxID=1344416 RepID=A0A139A6I5_GONPJ|nr:phosphatases II [Gonapodya prolifera JEL478]|eukprot:KXS11983.1 phosphatases II [Gonapodya prolifera JEL478]